MFKFFSCVVIVIACIVGGVCFGMHCGHGLWTCKTSPIVVQGLSSSDAEGSCAVLLDKDKKGCCFSHKKVISRCKGSSFDCHCEFKKSCSKD